MAISLDEFDAKKFGAAGRREEGYNVDQVDSFLQEIRSSIVEQEALANDYSSTKQLLALANQSADESADRVRELEERVRELENGAVVAPDPDREAAEATSVLVRAQKIASEVTSEAHASAQSTVSAANSEAETIRREAAQHATSVVTDADREAKSTVSAATATAKDAITEANKEARSIVAEAKKEEKVLRVTVDSLRGEEKDVRVRLRDFLAQHLESVSAGLDDK